MEDTSFYKFATLKSRGHFFIDLVFINNYFLIRWVHGLLAFWESSMYFGTIMISEVIINSICSIIWNGHAQTCRVHYQFQKTQNKMEDAIDLE